MAMVSPEPRSRPFLHRQVTHPGDFHAAAVPGALVVGRPIHCFPMGWVLTGPVLARLAAWAVRIPVVAQVIYCLIGPQRADQAGEAEPVREQRFTGYPDLPVVLAHVPAPRPRPAVIRAALRDFGQVSVYRVLPGRHGTIIFGVCRV